MGFNTYPALSIRQPDLGRTLAIIAQMKGANFRNQLLRRRMDREDESRRLAGGAIDELSRFAGAGASAAPSLAQGAQGAPQPSAGQAVMASGGRLPGAPGGGAAPVPGGGGVPALGGAGTQAAAPTPAAAAWATPFQGRNKVQAAIRNSPMLRKLAGVDLGAAVNVVKLFNATFAEEKPPTGYRYAESGDLEPIRGGPADPAMGSGPTLQTFYGPKGRERKGYMDPKTGKMVPVGGAKARPGATLGQQGTNKARKANRRRLKELQKTLPPGVSLADELKRRMTKTDKYGAEEIDFNSYWGRLAWNAMQPLIGQDDPDHEYWSQIIMQIVPTPPPASPPAAAVEDEGPGFWSGVGDTIQGWITPDAGEAGAAAAPAVNAPARRPAPADIPVGPVAPAPAPASASPAAGTPMQVPMAADGKKVDAAQLVPGQAYMTKRGVAVWDGRRFTTAR